MTRPPAALSPGIRAHLGEQLTQHLGTSEASDLPLPLRDLIERLADVLAQMDNLEFRRGMIEVLPRLHAFALSLSANRHRADDLVQETLLKALRFRHTFEPGTNLQGWLFTILRRQFNDEFRRRKREVEDADGVFSSKLAVAPEQEARLGHRDLVAALGKLPPEQREALVLIGAEGASYEEAAATCGVPIGTIKSRLNRARARLAELLSDAAESPRRITPGVNAG